jgi:hypothetical protein
VSGVVPAPAPVVPEVESDVVVAVSDGAGAVVVPVSEGGVVWPVVGVVVGVVAHRGVVKVLSSRETWPLRASARPATTVPVVT